MPADFFIDAPRRVVFSKATGVFGWADAVDHMNRLQSHPDFRPEFNQLCDFRDANRVDLSHDEIQRLASRNIYSATSRRAFVVAGDFEFGLGRVFSTYREMHGEPGIRIFREMNKALSWLSLAAEPDPSLFARCHLAGRGDS
jgi:hypothetical protein